MHPAETDIIKLHLLDLSSFESESSGLLE
jgi:hypothetical protein